MVRVYHEESGLKKFFKLLLVFFVALFIFNWLFGVITTDSILEPQIVVIPITGEISLSGGNSLFGPGGLGADEIVEQIEDANEDADIAAIILEINSPGGTVVASEDISRAIEQSTKPTIAWLREIATSGGYWIAASTDEIVADPATITGSIGVTGSYLSYENLFNEYGIKYEKLVSGPYKDTGTPFRNLTKAERNLMQSKINTINDMFIQHIMDKRNMSIREARGVATGEIFLGSEAIKLGLVDSLGSKKEAITAAENLAGLTDSRIVSYERKAGIIERLSALTKIDIEINTGSNFVPRS